MCRGDTDNALEFNGGVLGLTSLCMPNIPFGCRSRLAADSDGDSHEAEIGWRPATFSQSTMGHCLGMAISATGRPVVGPSRGLQGARPQAGWHAPHTLICPDVQGVRAGKMAPLSTPCGWK